MLVRENERCFVGETDGQPDRGRRRVAVRGGSPPTTRWWAVTAVAVGAVCLSVADSGVLGTALPAVRGGFGVSAGDAAWISTASLLCQTTVIPGGAWLAERWGLRRTLLVALAL